MPHWNKCSSSFFGEIEREYEKRPHKIEKIGKLGQPGLCCKDETRNFEIDFSLTSKKFVWKNGRKRPAGSFDEMVFDYEKNEPSAKFSTHAAIFSHKNQS